MSEFKSADGVYRGEIWSVRNGEAFQDKEQYHDMIVVSKNEENCTKPYVMAVNLVKESGGRPRPSRFPVKVNGEVRYAVCESVRRVSVERISSYRASISDDEEMMLNRGLLYAVGIDPELLMQNYQTIQEGRDAIMAMEKYGVDMELMSPTDDQLRKIKSLKESGALDAASMPSSFKEAEEILAPFEKHGSEE